MDVVHARGANAAPYDFGRASGNAYWESRDMTVVEQQSQAAAAQWNKTKDGAASAWNHTKAFATQPPAIPPDEPQRYGRAGGFAGIELFEVPQPGVGTLSSAPANADAVKTGESQWGYTERTTAGSTHADHGTSSSTPSTESEGPQAR
jgi:hypothetical protein